MLNLINKVKIFLATNVGLQNSTVVVPVFAAIILIVIDYLR